MSQPEAPSLEVLRQHCKALCLPTTRQIVGDALETARREDWPLETFLHFLLSKSWLDVDGGASSGGSRHPTCHQVRHSLPLTRSACRCVYVDCCPSSVAAICWIGLRIFSSLACPALERRILRLL